MRIAVAADHAGYALKERIAEHLRVLGHDVVDFGTRARTRRTIRITADRQRRASGQATPTEASSSAVPDRV